jgi:hypothetical protein
VPVSLFALAFVLLQAAAATPAAEPAPTRTPTPRPVSAGPRTLQDVARERRLSGGARGKGSLGTISGSPSTASPAPKTGGAAATPTPEAAPAASVRVATVSNDGIVDGTGGVRVFGTVRNAGSGPACNVMIAVKIFDSRGDFLASGQAAPDVAVIPPGEVVSFRAAVQAPPGVRGALRNPDRKDLTEGSTSMGGDWKLLGGTEAAVATATEDCTR